MTTILVGDERFELSNPPTDEEWDRLRAAEDAEALRRQHQERGDLAEQLLPRRFADVDLLTVDQPEEVRKALIRWATTHGSPGSGNLWLVGPAGTGKTWAAYAVARQLVMQGDPVKVWPVVELLDGLRPDGGLDPLDVAKVPTLVLDDLGGERPTDWTAERLYLMVNRRWLDALPTIVTTNLTPPALRKAVGERTYDRLRDGALALTFGGESRRKPAP